MTLVQELHENGKVEFEGQTWYVLPGKGRGDLLEPGDKYIAQRNSGPKLLTCKRVRETDARWSGWVVPEEPNAYSFDFWECVGVTLEEPS